MCRQPGHFARNCVASSGDADVPRDDADPAPPSSADADSAPPSADDAADPAPSSFAHDAPPSSADDVADPAPPSSVDDADDPLPSDSDAVEMSCVPDSEPCSGDEEVLQSACPVSLSPRRTRSSGPASNFPVDLPDSAPLVLDSSSPPESPLPRRLRFKPYLDVVVQRFRRPAERAPSPVLAAGKAAVIEDTLNFSYLTRRIVDDTATFEMYRMLLRRLS